MGMMCARIINTVVGCPVDLLFIAVGPPALFPKSGVFATLKMR